MEMGWLNGLPFIGSYTVGIFDAAVGHVKNTAFICRCMRLEFGQVK